MFSKFQILKKRFGGEWAVLSFDQSAEYFRLDEPNKDLQLVACGFP